MNGYNKYPPRVDWGCFPFLLILLLIIVIYGLVIWWVSR